MKSLVDQAAAEFLKELEETPDQLNEFPAFRLKRQVKSLYQTVCNLEVPVSTILRCKLVCIGPQLQDTTKTSSLPAQRDALSEQLDQYDGVRSYTQVSIFDVDQKIHTHVVSLY